MIVATAGHVDHGKTSLVLALTGVDCDRLPEEKRRGMTIEPGFANANLGGAVPMGFVDVPGHVRFVRHMLAGVSAVDFALLVVAADDGPMPQTLEHLAVLDLLGLTRGVVALTKIDRVDAARLEESCSAVAALLAGTSLRAVPVLPVSAVTGEGLDALRGHLRAVQATLPAHEGGHRFRLAVDRCFTRPGAGLVVAGAVLSGRVSVGDELVVSPAGSALRVRSLQVHGLAQDHAQAGQRCALNVAPTGSNRIEIERGDWLVAPSAHAPTARLDVSLRWLAGMPNALAGDVSLQLHLGAAQRSVRAVPLAARRIEPGKDGVVQLVLDRPVSALHGDRFVLRDAAAQRVVGGGYVLDAFAPARGRRRPARLAELDATAQPTAALALAGLLAARPDGVDACCFALAWNLAPDAWCAWRETVAVEPIELATGLRLVAPSHWQALMAGVERILAHWHAAHPDSIGLPVAAVVSAAGSRGDAQLRHAAVRARLKAGVVVRDGFMLRLPGHQARLQPQDEALLERVRTVMQACGPRPPPLGELAPSLGLDLRAAEQFLQRAAVLGHLVQVARNRFFLPSTIEALVAVARDVAAATSDGRFEAASFRDRSGLGRNLSIQLLEFFDRSGITRYAAERRTIVASDPA